MRWALYRYRFSKDQMVRQHHRQIILIGSTDLDLYETDSHECPTNCQIEQWSNNLFLQ